MLITPYPQVTLPNGMPIFCLNKSEAKVIYRDLPKYFRHRIEVCAGDTVFDVGANIGAFTLWIYQQCSQDVNIYAFEPIPQIFNILRLNIECFDPGRVKGFPLGLFRERKTITFTYFPKATAWSSAYRDRSNMRSEQERAKKSTLVAIREGQFPWLRLVPPSIQSLLLNLGMKKAFETGQEIDCEVTTVSEIVREHDVRRIDLLKVDVEGSELDVLMGIEDRDWPKVRQLVVEVEDFDRRSNTVITLLDKKEFKHIESEQDNVQKAGNYGMIYARR